MIKAIEILKSQIRDNQIKEAFLLMNQIVKMLPSNEIERFSSDILLLESQYNNYLHGLQGKKSRKNIEFLSTSRNRIVCSLLSYVLEIELLSDDITFRMREFKKFKWSIEVSRAKAYENLEYYLEQSSKATGKLNEDFEDYIRQKIQKLERLHSIMERKYIAILIPFVSYFIIESIKSIINWDAQMHKNIKLTNHDFNLHLYDQNENPRVDIILLIDTHHNIHIHQEEDNISGSHHNNLLHHQHQSHIHHNDGLSSNDHTGF